MTLIPPHHHHNRNRQTRAPAKVMALASTDPHAPPALYLYFPRFSKKAAPQCMCRAGAGAGAGPQYILTAIAIYPRMNRVRKGNL